MILVTHAVTGAAIATLIPNSPTAAFSLAFVSHYVLDTMPHWDYSLKSNYKLSGFLALKKQDKITDLLKFGSDAVLAICLPVFLALSLHASWWYIIIGATFGVLPDALSFIIDKEPWNVVNRLHAKFHTKEMVNDKLSFFSQSAVVAIIMFLALWL